MRAKQFKVGQVWHVSFNDQREVIVPFVVTAAFEMDGEILFVFVNDSSGHPITFDRYGRQYAWEDHPSGAFIAGRSRAKAHVIPRVEAELSA